MMYVCVCASSKMLMHVCTRTCTVCVYLACCLLEQGEGSLSQLPLETGVKLEGWGSLVGLEEVRETFICSFGIVTLSAYEKDHNVEFHEVSA